MMSPREADISVHLFRVLLNHQTYGCLHFLSGEKNISSKQVGVNRKLARAAYSKQCCACCTERNLTSPVFITIFDIYIFVSSAPLSTHDCVMKGVFIWSNFTILWDTFRGTDAFCTPTPTHHPHFPHSLLIFFIGSWENFHSPLHIVVCT